MDEPAERSQGLFASVKRLLQTVLAIGTNRCELALVEFQEERVRFFEALLLVTLVAGLGLLTLLVVALTVMVVCLQGQRIDLLVGLGVIYLAATLGFFWRLRNRVRTWKSFSATLAEIKKDKACLAGKS